MIFSVIAIPKRPPRRNVGTVSFPSTLYLAPVLDLLLARVPEDWQNELRLGLQEALVNAVKHGNKLDPSKTIAVRYSCRDRCYSWTICNSGDAEVAEAEADCCCNPHANVLPSELSECGRGMFILSQVFDRVDWNPQQRELKLCKQIARSI